MTLHYRPILVAPPRATPVVGTATIWWDEEEDDTRGVPHACSDACTRAVRGSWVCTVTGMVLGPALMVAPPHRADVPSVKNRADCTVAARGRFVTAVQDLLARLVSGDKRAEVEGARASKARALALRCAARALAADAEAGRMPNMGDALCHAWAAYERSTNAMAVSTELDADMESRLLHECGEFFCAHLAREPGPDVQECRPRLEALALALVYFMREGIPSKLKRSKFLSANLPDLGRLRSYGLSVAHFTHGRRYIQSVLDSDAQPALGGAPFTHG